MNLRLIFQLEPRHCWLLVVILPSLVPIQGQTNYQQINSFGWPQQASGTLTIPLLDGRDGNLYGSAVGGAWLYGTVYKIGQNGEPYQALHHFSAAEGQPLGPLARSRAGGFYGTTARGIFKLGEGGTGYSWIWSFKEGLYDQTSGVVEGTDGSLFVTTRLGGGKQGGSILKVDSDGSGFSVLHAFDETDAYHTSHPVGLILGKDGALFGVTDLGGPFINDSFLPSGIAFTINEDGSGYELLHTFGSPEDGENPISLIQGSDGNLYGTTAVGGQSGGGTLFRLAADGSGFRVLLSFGSASVPGRNPLGLSQGPDGFLYGTVSEAAFRVDTNGGNFTILHEFHQDGLNAPTVTAGSNGVLYGTTLESIYRLNTNGSNFQLLYRVLPSGGDASSPSTPLVEGKTNRMLYGISSFGGKENVGAMFSLGRNGSAYSVLFDFSVSRGDGVHPAGLIEGSEGILYGTTWAGGGANKGTVFRINREGGAYTVLHSFEGLDGSNPIDGVSEGKEGRLYGTTPSGGNGNLGGVFGLNKDGSGFSLLWSFTGGDNGLGSPHATVIQGTDAVLYGTTTNGVFSLDSSRRLRVLHRFDGDELGLASRSKLLEASDGYLYGTAWGSTPAVAFKLSKDGSTYQVIHTFSLQEGPDLFGSLVEGPDGALYGVSSGDASLGIPGAVFKIGKDGSAFQLVHRFDPGTGGGYSPQTGLLVGSDNNLYGVTVRGGDMNLGTIFRLSSSPYPVRITRLQMQPDGFSLNLIGNPNQAYNIQATAVVTSGWSDLGSVVANSEGVGKFIDSKVQLQSNRFYRAQAQE